MKYQIFFHKIQEVHKKIQVLCLQLIRWSLQKMKLPGRKIGDPKYSLDQRFLIISDFIFSHSPLLNEFYIIQILLQDIYQIAMEAGPQKYSKYYQELRRDFVLKNKFKDIDTKTLKKNIASIKEDIMFQSKKKDDEAVEELHFYKAKFEDLQKLLKDNKKKLSTSYVSNEGKKIFAEQRYFSSKKASKAKSLEKSKKQLHSFFIKKKEALESNGFQSLLEQPISSSTRSFRKKLQSNNIELERLRRQNIEIENKIKYMLTLRVAGLNEQERKNQIEARIQELQEQNERLYQENTKIRTEFNSSSNSRPTISSVEQVLTSPYLLYTKENDLYKIEKRNILNPQERSIDNLFPGMTQGYSQYENYDQNATFGRESIYNMSECSLNPALYTSTHFGIESKKIASRNKVAFFKKQGVLLRDKNIDVAYKKSYPGENLDKIILNIYIQNNTAEKEQTTIEYDYERKYYKLTNHQSIYNIEPFKQKRQIIELELDSQKQDINSICEGVIHFGSINYKFWVPAIFVLFKRYSENGNFSFKEAFTKTASKEVIVNSAFRTPQQMQKHVPELEYEGNEGVLWGISRVNEGPINLRWRDGGKVQIKTCGKWIDAIGFALIDYQ